MSLARFILALLLFSRLGSAFLDLFLSTSEVTHLLGVSREMYYVMNGDVKENALDFDIPVSEALEHLHFTWKAEAGTQVSYSIKALSHEAEALYQPSLNISHSGQVPRTHSVWRLSLPCSGLKSAKVLVTIEIELAEPVSGMQKKLLIKRNKFCSAKALNRDPISISPPRVPPHHIFAGILLGGFIFALFFVGSILCFHIRNRNHKPQSFQYRTSSHLNANKAGSNTEVKISNSHFVANHFQEVPGLPHQQQSLPFYNAMNNFEQGNENHYPIPHLNMVYRGGIESDHNNPLSEAESRVTDWVQSQQQRQQSQQNKLNGNPDDIMAFLEVDRLNLKLGQLLQEGTFGRIYQGTLMNNDGSSSENDVYIKTVIAGSAVHQSQNLIKDATVLFGTNHNHVQTLIASTWDGTSPMLIYPYLSCGNLKKFLQQNNQAAFSTHALVSLGLQMLKALQHLHKRKIIHKDVATRNCFLGDGLLLKLSDSSLARDIFPGDYHCLGDNENRPIKWMPYEAIGQKKYSRFSDVWSFGVYMWELMTRAQQPFSDIDPFEMESYLLEGYLLHQPMNCPDQLYSVLVLCWATRTGDRATVHNLYNQLQNLQKQLQQFV